MSLWVVWLARFDLRVTEFGRLPLYALGLILTFNLGRDITLITLYPFMFGALLIWWIDRHRMASAGSKPNDPPSPAAQLSPGAPPNTPAKPGPRPLVFAVANRPKFTPRRL
jgi:hypothetical protein